MAETDTIAADQTTTPAYLPRDDRDNIDPFFLDRIDIALETSDFDEIRELTRDLHETDMAELIDALDADERVQLIRVLGDDFDFTALTELDENIRNQVIDALPDEQVAEGFLDLDSDDAVFILEDLDEEDQVKILSKLPIADRIKLQRGLDYPEDSAGRIMQSDFIAIPPFWTVGQAIDYMREAEDLPDQFYDLLVVDVRFTLLGTVPLNTLLRTKRPTKIQDIMLDARHMVKPDEDQEEVAHLFERYNLVTTAVIDDTDRLVGVITIDDIVDVIQEEADEDIKRLAGVGDEEISDNIVETIKSRFVWLLVNLGTAILASFVIGLFDGTLQEMVALAVLMPIVASMGGNAGTQTMTVAVRALATRDLDNLNVRRFITRETLVGLLNGVIFALIIGVVTVVWFGNAELAGVIAVAMVINMVSAGMAGIFIPLCLEKTGADPAIASSVFVTTVTDVVGFYAFLGLAAWWFVL
ncbi:magnesium transporter [Coralliovum pocilloporae]|uniref:magnesium transporter n=1 Tax=Coralliovum pocilloporae TaxID=3066369 RepID=UPI00330717AE